MCSQDSCGVEATGSPQRPLDRNFSREGAWCPVRLVDDQKFPWGPFLSPHLRGLWFPPPTCPDWGPRVPCWHLGRGLQNFSLCVQPRPPTHRQSMLHACHQSGLVVTNPDCRPPLPCVCATHCGRVAAGSRLSTPGPFCLRGPPRPCSRLTLGHSTRSL